MICIYCNKEIKEDERKYYSKQAGMQGLYHWNCFIIAAKEFKRHEFDTEETLKNNEEYWNQ